MNTNQINEMLDNIGSKQEKIFQWDNLMKSAFELNSEKVD